MIFAVGLLCANKGRRILIGAEKSDDEKINNFVQA